MHGWKIPVAVTAGVLALSAVLATTVSAQTTTATAATHQAKPTIVLVHGAFEDASSWDGEIARLGHDGYPVIAPAVPLRGLASDAAYVTAIVRTIHGPVVVAGHSYGGQVATEVAAQDPQQVKALVYAAATIPEAGETEQQLLTQFPGTLLGPDTTYTVSAPGGVTDTYVKPASFHALFAGDRSVSAAAVAAATQRPIAASALTEPAAAGVPAGIPVYAIVAGQDKGIPPAAERFEAQRVGATIYTVNSAHDLPTSHPAQVTQVIEHAAR